MRDHYSPRSRGAPSSNPFPRFEDDSSKLGSPTEDVHVERGHSQLTQGTHFGQHGSRFWDVRTNGIAKTESNTQIYKSSQASRLEHTRSSWTDEENSLLMDLCGKKLMWVEIAQNIGGKSISACMIQHKKLRSQLATNPQINPSIHEVGNDTMPSLHNGGHRSRLYDSYRPHEHSRRLAKDSYRPNADGRSSRASRQNGDDLPQEYGRPHESLKTGTQEYTASSSLTPKTPNEKIEKEERKKLDRKRWSLEDDERLQELISKNTNLQVLFKAFPDRTEGAVKNRFSIFKKLEKFQADAQRDQSHVAALQRNDGNDELPGLEGLMESHDTHNDNSESSESDSGYDISDLNGTITKSARKSLQNSKTQDGGKKQTFKPKEPKINSVGPAKWAKVEDNGIVVPDSDLDSDREGFSGTAKAVETYGEAAHKVQNGFTLPKSAETTEQAGMGVWVPLGVLSQLMRTSKGGESVTDRKISSTAVVANNTASSIKPTTSGLAPSLLLTSNARSPPNTPRLASEITTPKLSTDTAETTTAKRSRSSSQLTQDIRSISTKRPRIMSGANSTEIGRSRLTVPGHGFGSRLNSAGKLREERDCF